MPTGYTAKLCNEEQSFQQFAMSCARAFGACMSMREESQDSEIPIFEPSDYHDKELAKAEEKLETLKNMLPKDKVAYGQAIKDKDVKYHKERIATIALTNARLNDMRRKVNAWTPPTEDHQEMRKFMHQQLTISLDDTDYHERKLDELETQVPINIQIDAVKKALRDIKYHTEERLKEIKRVKGRNDWVSQLKDSLKEGN